MFLLFVYLLDGEKAVDQGGIDPCGAVSTDDSDSCRYDHCVCHKRS